MIKRCPWSEQNLLLSAYHDKEWGVPEHDSRAMWEKLMLDGFQAGLSWLTILKKREAFREAFVRFDPQIVARFSDQDVDRLLQDPGIVRFARKIQAAIGNAQAYLAMQKAGEDFATFVWDLAGGKTLRGNGREIPASTALSAKISTALKARGFKFVGPVIVYAWMQAIGIVNDHVAGCFRR